MLVRAILRCSCMSVGFQLLILYPSLGALVSLTPPKEGGNTWEAKQIETLRSPLPFPGQPKARLDINWSYGPVKVLWTLSTYKWVTYFGWRCKKVIGYIDTSTFFITITVSVLGINIGTVSGNLKDGVIINFDLVLAKGTIKFYLKNGNELWVRLDVEVRFDGSFKGDYKIITI
jgi:hypothetical protein